MQAGRQEMFVVMCVSVSWERGGPDFMCRHQSGWVSAHSKELILPAFALTEMETVKTAWTGVG